MTQAIFKCTYDSKAHGLFVEEVSIDLAPGVESIPADHMETVEVMAKRRFKKHTLERPTLALKNIECRFVRYEPTETAVELCARIRNQ